MTEPIVTLDAECVARIRLASDRVRDALRIRAALQEAMTAIDMGSAVNDAALDVARSRIWEALFDYFLTAEMAIGR